jgi:2-hydroxy-3-oxopropionate reductase
MKKKVGFIGLGAMGRPMARNLLKAGYELHVYDIDPAAGEEMKKEGASIADSPRNVAELSEVVLTMLPDSPEVEQVYLAEAGLVAGAHEGLILVDSSTVDPETTRRIGAIAASKKVRMLDSPVGGGVPNAIQGNLILLVGGEASTLKACQEILRAIGDRIIHVGPLGSGETLKLINNLMMGIYVFSLVEGFSLAAKAGLDQEKLLSMLKGNLVSFFERHTANILRKDFRPGFRTRLGQKDLRLALKMAESVGASLPFGALAKEMYRLAMNHGLGDSDWSSILTLYEQP